MTIIIDNDYNEYNDDNNNDADYEIHVPYNCIVEDDDDCTLSSLRTLFFLQIKS